MNYYLMNQHINCMRNADLQNEEHKTGMLIILDGLTSFYINWFFENEGRSREKKAKAIDIICKITKVKFRFSCNCSDCKQKLISKNVKQT